MRSRETKMGIGKICAMLGGLGKVDGEGIVLLHYLILAVCLIAALSLRDLIPRVAAARNIVKISRRRLCTLPVSFI